MDMNGSSITNIAEIAKSLGKATGTISSVMFCDATPAGFGAHNINRFNYTEIAQEMLLDSKLDVIMGAGHPLYDNNSKLMSAANGKYVGGLSVYYDVINGRTNIDTDGDGIGDNMVEDANGDGMVDAWHFVEERADFQALMKGDVPDRVFGLAQVFSTLQYYRASSAGYIEESYEYDMEKISDKTTKIPVNRKTVIENSLIMPGEDPFNENVPTLEEMTNAALNVLDNDPDGFFLHIEGGAVDLASHQNLIARMIEEQIDFNNAVEECNYLY